MSAASRTAEPHTLAAETPGVPALAGDHAALMREAARRTTAVAAALDAREWPESELRALISFLQGSVLRQASDEEVRLFPPNPHGTPFAELSAEHDRLRAMILELGRVHADRCPPARVRSLVADVRTALERHLLAEADLLGRLPVGKSGVPADADGPVVITLDGAPTREAVQRCIERVLRLRRGQRADIYATDARRIREVCRWMGEFDTVGYGYSQATTDDGRLHLQISRRRGD